MLRVGTPQLWETFTTLGDKSLRGQQLHIILYGINWETWKSSWEGKKWLDTEWAVNEHGLVDGQRSELRQGHAKPMPGSSSFKKKLCSPKHSAAFSFQEPRRGGWKGEFPRNHGGSEGLSLPVFCDAFEGLNQCLCLFKHSFVHIYWEITPC